MFSSSALPIINEKGESSAENTAKRDSTSRQLKFDNTDGVTINKKEPDRHKISLFSKIQSVDTTKKLGESVTACVSDIKNVENLNAPLETLSIKRLISAPTKSNDEHKLCTELQTPKVKYANNDGIVASISNPNEDETPYKTFHLPQTANIRRAQTTSQHRTLLSSATQSKKNRSDLENEFRSQRVLFRTPSAVPRTAIKAMNHLGLDDSLKCYQSSTMINLSPVQEEKNQDSKQPAVEHMTNKEEEKHAANKEADKPNSNSTEIEDKKKVITINGKDFVIQSKLGQGGSSTVFLVEHKETKVPCALKVFQ